MATQPRKWDARLRAWASQQTQPFTMEQAVKAAGMVPEDQPVSHGDRAHARGILRRLGYAPSRPTGAGGRAPAVWWHAPTPAVMALEDRARQLLELWESLDAAANSLTQELQAWESELVARQDRPPAPVDTEDIYQGALQEGQRAREIEILAIIDRQLSALKAGTQGYLHLWTLRQMIKGIDE